MSVNEGWPTWEDVKADLVRWSKNSVKFVIGAIFVALVILGIFWWIGGFSVIEWIKSHPQA